MEEIPRRLLCETKLNFSRPYNEKFIMTTNWYTKATSIPPRGVEYYKITCTTIIDPHTRDCNRSVYKDCDCSDCEQLETGKSIRQCLFIVKEDNQQFEQTLISPTQYNCSCEARSITTLNSIELCVALPHIDNPDRPWDWSTFYRDARYTIGKSNSEVP